MHSPVRIVNIHIQPTVHVLATTLDGTRAALGAAVPLARGGTKRGAW